jgi:hypothetical protein
MPNWKKILLNGGDGELTTLKLTNLTEDSTGTKILTLDSSNNIKLTASFSGGGGGTVTGVTGTAPIVSSGGTTPAISINAATTSAAGSMSSTDKTKLNGLVSVSTNSIIVRGGQATAQSSATSLTGGSSDNGKFLRFNYASEGIAGNASTWSLESISVSLTSNVTGTLPEGNGGTGVTSLSSLDLSEFNNDLSLGDLSGTLAVSKGGTGASNLNSLVQTSGAQSIAGVKTFSSLPVFSSGINIGSTSYSLFTYSSLLYLTAPSGVIAIGGGPGGAQNDLKIPNGSLAVGNITNSTTNGRIDASNDVVAFSTSDKRLKKYIKNIKNPLDKISKINGVTFEWKKADDKMKKEVHSFEGNDVGVLAQEVEKVLPEVVATRDNGYKAVRYEKIIPLLIEAIKDQQKQIDELKSKL